MPPSSPKVPHLPSTMAGDCGSWNTQAAKDIKMKPEEQLVLNLYDPQLRGNALAELSKKRGTINGLALLLWISFGTIIELLQELLAVYPYAYSHATLSASASSRACHALALLQTVASHPETRIRFIKAHIPVYCYPFLDCANEGRAYESLRITSLGVLGALVKVHDAEVIEYLLESEVIPLCLRIMEMGSELSKTVATFIIEKILLDDAGLTYVCATVDRFFHVFSVLEIMVAELVDKPSTRLLKHVICCYLRLTYDSRALVALRLSFPEALNDGTFGNCLRGDAVAVQWHQELLYRLRNGRVEGASLPGPDPAEGGSSRGGAPPAVPGNAAGGSSGGIFSINGIWTWKTPS